MVKGAPGPAAPPPALTPMVITVTRDDLIAACKEPPQRHPITGELTYYVCHIPKGCSVRIDMGFGLWPALFRVDTEIDTTSLVESEMVCQPSEDRRGFMNFHRVLISPFLRARLAIVAATIIGRYRFWRDNFQQKGSV